MKAILCCEPDIPLCLRAFRPRPGSIPAWEDISTNLEFMPVRLPESDSFSDRLSWKRAAALSMERSLGGRPHGRTGPGAYPGTKANGSGPVIPRISPGQIVRERVGQAFPGA